MESDTLSVSALQDGPMARKSDTLSVSESDTLSVSWTLTVSNLKTGPDTLSVSALQNVSNLKWSRIPYLSVGRWMSTI